MEEPTILSLKGDSYRLRGKDLEARPSPALSDGAAHGSALPSRNTFTLLISSRVKE